MINNALSDYSDMSDDFEFEKDEGGFVVSFPELPGFITCGETVESAVANALDAKKAWLEAAMEDGIESVLCISSFQKRCSLFKIAVAYSICNRYNEMETLWQQKISKPK